MTRIRVPVASHKGYTSMFVWAPSASEISVINDNVLQMDSPLLCATLDHRKGGSCASRSQDQKSKKKRIRQDGRKKDSPF